MNKSDIIKAAEVAKSMLANYNFFTTGDLVKIYEALIAAAELLKEVEEGIKDMAVAHDMSHAPMCDEGYWKGEFREKTNKLLEMLK